MTLADLGLESVEEACYATKTALWCCLRSDWSVDKLGINPGADQTAAQRVLQAGPTRSPSWLPADMKCRKSPASRLAGGH